MTYIYVYKSKNFTQQQRKICSDSTINKKGRTGIPEDNSPVGMAYDEDELKKLKLLAESIRIKLEAGNQQFLFKPEEIVNLKRNKEKYSDSSYQVNLKNLVEEQRLISGIHQVYSKLFSDTKYERVIKNPAKYKMAVRIFSDMVLSRIANPESKRASVDRLEKTSG